MALFFGYQILSYSFDGVAPDAMFDRVVGLAQAAESAGFDAVTVIDHFENVIPGREDMPVLEAYTVLPALAACTRRVHLGALVTGVTYRNPALLAKMVTSLDVISRGRAILGLGAAWYEREHRSYDFDLPPIGVRMDRLDEALTICRLMFTQERASFAGKHHRIDEAINQPRPIQPGGPRIWIGGGGEKRTLRLLARHGDIGHWSGTLEDLRRKKDVLERHCEAEGRDPNTILRTVGSPVVLVENEAQARQTEERIPPERRAMFQPATVDRAAELLRPYVDAGFQGFTFNNLALPRPESIALASELMARLA
ncbi:MAG TPA: LLM class F420-dependent oxidoreductase [Candidatus Dormibacteraeota bacterium]|nr:LLM class F420-dependent oxidoreductase [Candidatus Dormibacteraeota bacterium]